MIINKTHNVTLQKTYDANAATILNLFKDNTVFKLTGADYIESDFIRGGLFCLTFKERGTINGRFIKLTDNDIIIEWNVDGFQRPKEINTLLEISLHNDNGKCILILDHKNILHAEAAAAKQRAWTEILDILEQRINSSH